MTTATTTGAATAEQELLDLIARSYNEEDGFERVLMRYKVQAILPLIRGGGHALDVGCGYGHLCRVLSEHCRSVVGVDGSPEKIARASAENRPVNVSYHCSLFEDWEAPRRFDAIVATNFLEHVADPVGFLTRCRDLLSDGRDGSGGRVIVTVPNALSLHKRIGRAMGLIDDFYALTQADREKGHLRIYDRDRLAADFRSAGLRPVVSSGILLKPFSHKQMEGVDPKIVDALLEVGKDLPDWCTSLLVCAERDA